ncbi:MAG: helix-turn-helix domain-containing protein [Acidimicrobiales bacterium]
MSPFLPPVRVVDREHLDGAERPYDERWDLVPVGWTALSGFDLPATPWDLASRRWVCIGAVTDGDSAQAAMVALARGVGLVVALELDGNARRRFAEDLARAGSSTTSGPFAALGLGDEHMRLLDALAAGLSVTAAAESAHLSRRTANRRLAEARSRLGVTTTVAAVSSWAALREDV